MGQKLTERPELSEAPASGDFFHVVDVDDPTDSPEGTSKRVQAQYLTIADATTSVKGKVELATDAETITGTDTVRAVTPSNITAKMDTDGTLAGNLDTRIPSQKAVKTYSAPLSEFITGWHLAGETPTYSSIDSPTGVITVASGAKTKYPIGSKIKFDQSQALTSYWSFDTNSNDGVGANNGTGTSMTYTAGKFGNAATFNGTTSKIVIADASSLKPTGEFTLGGWFKTSNTGALKALFASFAGLTNYAGILLEITTGNKLGFTSCNNTGTAAGSNFTSLIGTTTVTDNTFHNFVVTFRNNYAQVYLDGNLEVSGYCLAPAYQATNYVRVGCESYTGTDAQFMNGQIDDIYLINGYALDQDTIKAKYDAGTAQGTGSITVNKKAIVTATTDTTVTAYYGTDYALANSAITNFYYSLMRSPLGFPLDKRKWSVEVSNETMTYTNAPSANTYGNPGSLSISVPIGSFDVAYSASLFGYGQSATGNYQIESYASLSTSNSAESDNDFTAYIESISYISAFGVVVCGAVQRSKTLNLSAKATLYLICKNTQASTQQVGFQGANSKTIIRATCSYL